MKPPVEPGLRGSSNVENDHVELGIDLFVCVALIAAVLGFGGVAGQAAWIAQVLFVVFLVLFLVSAISGRRLPPV